MNKLVDPIGTTYGKLTVIGYSAPTSHGHKMLEVQCSCGNIKSVLQYLLRNGQTKSCGCLRKKSTGERFRKHGECSSKLFRVWWGMIARCHYEVATNYRYYGAREIYVCQEWRESYENFKRDMGEKYVPGLQIDRIDNYKGYSKDNCRWVTPKENAQNKRKPCKQKKIT